MACLWGSGGHKDNQIWHREQWLPTNETKERLQPGGRPTVPNSCAKQPWACKSTCHCKSRSRSFFRECASLKSEPPVWRGGAMREALRMEPSKMTVEVDWWLRIVGVFISGLRSYQWSLVDRQGSRDQPYLSWPEHRGSFQFLYEVTHSPSCRYGRFLLRLSSHQTDCSSPWAVWNETGGGQIMAFYSMFCNHCRQLWKTVPRREKKQKNFPLKFIHQENLWLWADS